MLCYIMKRQCFFKCGLKGFLCSTVLDQIMSLLSFLISQCGRFIFVITNKKSYSMNSMNVNRFCFSDLSVTGFEIFIFSNGGQKVQCCSKSWWVIAFLYILQYVCTVFVFLEFPTG